MLVGSRGGCKPAGRLRWLWLAGCHAMPMGQAPRNHPAKAAHRQAADARWPATQTKCTAVLHKAGTNLHPPARFACGSGEASGLLLAVADQRFRQSAVCCVPGAAEKSSRLPGRGELGLCHSPTGAWPACSPRAQAAGRRRRSRARPSRFAGLALLLEGPITGMVLRARASRSEQQAARRVGRPRRGRAAARCRRASWRQGV